MSNPDPTYRQTANGNTDRMLLLTCEWCGCAVVDREIHDQWHDDQRRELSRLAGRVTRQGAEFGIAASVLGLDDADLRRP